MTSTGGVLSRDTIYRRIGQAGFPDEFPFDDFTMSDFDNPENPLCDSVKLKQRKRLSLRNRGSFSSVPGDVDNYTIPLQKGLLRSSSTGTSPRPRDDDSDSLSDSNMPKFHPDQLPPASMTATTPATKRPRAKSLSAIFGQAAASSNARLIADHARSRLSAPLIDTLADQAVESDLPSDRLVQGSPHNSTFASLHLQMQIKESVEEDQEVSDEENSLLS